jgi:DNA-binding LytR/AlgR family response regulator
MLAGHLVQINRSQALRLTAVRSYRGNAQSGVLILLANGTEVAVSRRRVAAVTAALRATGQQRHEGG